MNERGFRNLPVAPGGKTLDLLSGRDGLGKRKNYLFSLN
jgi:hypothetical protein